MQFTTIEQQSTSIHYIYLKQILNHVYIDSYRNLLSQINHFLELLVYNLHSNVIDHKFIWNYTNDMFTEISLNNEDLLIDEDSKRWLLRTIKQKKYGILKSLIEEVLIANNHFENLSTSQLSVLIIDPKLTVLKFLNHVLKQNGIQTIRFQKADQALKYIDTVGPDIDSIICEYNLPDQDAADFLKHIKKSQYSETTVMFIANYEDTAKIREKFGIGTVDFLNKPIQADIVVSKIKALGK